MNSILQERFTDLVYRHIPGFRPRNGRGMVLCIFHLEKNPSLSIDLERCVFHCFGCGASGGAKRLAELIGKTWGSTRSESRAARARRARFQAERRSRAILEQRAEEQDLVLCFEHRELYGHALAAADLLSLFHRRPDLAEEFPGLVTDTEREYGETLFRLSILEARMDREVG